MRNNRTPLLILFVVVFIDMVGFGIIIPLLPYYAQTFAGEIRAVGSWLGLTMAPEGVVIAVLFSVYSLMQLIFSPIWGRLSDNFGRRPVLMWNLLGSVVAYFIFGIAGSLWVLFLSRVIQGVAGAKIATAQAYVADITTPEKRARGMGLIGAGLGLGFVFGPAIAGILISLETTVLSFPWMDALLQHNIYSLPGYFAAILALANFVLLYFLLPEPDRKKRTPDKAQKRFWNATKLRTILGNPQLVLLLGIVFLATTAFSSMESMFALWGESSLGIDEKTNSYLFAYIGVLIAINQGMLVGRLAEWLGERRLVVIGTGTLMLALVALPFSGSIWTLMVVLAFLAFGSGINTPSLQSLISQVSYDSDVGGTLGISQSTSSFARIVGPLLGGSVYDMFGISYPFLFGAGIMLVAFGISWRLFDRRSELVFEA
ncbi:MAG: MFS transporter [Candidatus Marinimicrobia bacterium]|nr:MFS transporter [Candidatus Neomarinimicrobiota bacterium]MCF7829107.1 MFS transporter [Candidatus Neomarinimicrobiota bacterium]MCF7881494.1 MFS transporter [Candidatus Neomarinimicrobiota bacterium]